MSRLVLAWRRPPARLRLAWAVGSATAIERQENPPDTIAAVIGSKGDRGLTGPAGRDSDQIIDPGDLTLLFENKLI